MGKYRNKKRRKLQKLKEELAFRKTLNYYHQPEDVKELEDKIKKLKDSINY